MVLLHMIDVQNCCFGYHWRSRMVHWKQQRSRNR